MVLDVATETVSETDAGILSADLRSHPRGFVKGDHYDTGEVVNQDVNDEAVFFTPRAATRVPRKGYGVADHPREGCSGGGAGRGRAVGPGQPGCPR